MRKENDRGRFCVPAVVSAIVWLTIAASPGPVQAQAAAPDQPAPQADSVDTARRSFTFAEVVALAAEQSPDLAMARVAITASERRVSAAKARRYPVVGIEGTVLRWNEPLAFQFAIPGMPVDPNAPTSTIREQYTGAVTLRAVQPLSSLIVIGKLVTAERAGLRAATADVETAGLEVVTQAARAFLGALQFRALRDLARESIARLDGQIEQARALVNVGALDNVDMMRLDAARAAAEQDLAVMEAAVRSADETLLLLLGLPLDLELDLVDDFPAQLPVLPIDEAAAATRALQRPSLRAADERAIQANGPGDLAKANMYPTLAAIAQVDHNEGAGTFASDDSWFVGLTLSWTLWDWGLNYNTMKAAQAQAKGARMAADRARDRVRLEARSAVRTARAAYQALDAARRGAAAAEEAYRIQSVRYQEGALTTTDLLVSQVDATRARGAQALARFKYLAALVDVQRATGQTPQLTAATPLEGSK